MAGEQFDNLARVTPGGAGATYVSGNVAFDSSASTFAISDGGPRVINLSVSAHTSRILNVIVNTVVMPLNLNVALIADGLYTFAFIAHPQDTFSFSFSGSTTINYFVVTMSRQ